MPITLKCPTCGATCKAADSFAGKAVKCPKCAGRLMVPGPDDTELADEHVAPVSARPNHSPAVVPKRRARDERHYDEDEDDGDRRPVPTREVAALPGDGRAKAAVVILLVNLAVRVVLLFDNLYQDRLSDRAAWAQAEVYASDALGIAVGLALFAVNLATAIAVSLWIYQVYDNLASLRAAGRRYSPGWAVAYFFIPFVNFVLPYQVVQEIWRASDPAVPAESRYAWQGHPGSVLVGFWWAFWLICEILGLRSFNMGMSPYPEPNLARFSALADGFAVSAALLLVLVINRIRVRQAEKHAHILAARDRDEGAEETDDER
jgi:hypothetical protein